MHSHRRSAAVFLATFLLAACNVGVDDQAECDLDFAELKRARVQFPAADHTQRALSTEEPCFWPSLDECPWRYSFSDAYPSWSPDGRSVAYIGADAATLFVGLYVYDLVTGETRLVGFGPDNMSSQAWSPDSRHLTFSMGKQIWKTTLDGRCVTQLTTTGENFDPAWSPNGRWIAYNNSVGPKETGIYLIDIAGRTEQWRFAGGMPTWHPDGQRVLIHQGVGPPVWGSRLLRHSLQQPHVADTLDFMPGELLQLTDYSPDGAYIVLKVSSRQGEIDIWRINHEGGGLRRLTTNGGDMAAWSPDGRTIAYANIDSSEGRGKIWLMNPEGNDRRPMRNGTHH